MCDVIFVFALLQTIKRDPNLHVSWIDYSYVVKKNVLMDHFKIHRFNTQRPRVLGQYSNYMTHMRFANLLSVWFVQPSLVPWITKHNKYLDYLSLLKSQTAIQT